MDFMILARASKLNTNMHLEDFKTFSLNKPYSPTQESEHDQWIMNITIWIDQDLQAQYNYPPILS